MIAVFALCLAAVQHPTHPVLVWGGDAEGGAPFVEADPRDPSRVRGFDVEVAERIAHGLGGDRSAQFLQVQWSNIDQSVERGDFTLGLSGVEDTRRGGRAMPSPCPTLNSAKCSPCDRQTPRTSTVWKGSSPIPMSTSRRC